MNKLKWALGTLTVVGVTTAVAQPPVGRGGAGGPFGDGPPPLIRALDADHDHVISADELKNATTSLLSLDKNHDGKLTDDEFGPPGGGPGSGGGQGGRMGDPRDRGGKVRRPPSRDDTGRNRPDGGPQGRPGGDSAGPPDPKRMVEHAMQFDINKDGQLSQDELKKFAEDCANHRRPDGGSGPNPSDKGQRPQRPD